MNIKSLIFIIILLLPPILAVPSVYGTTGAALFMNSNSTAKIYAVFDFNVRNKGTWNFDPMIRSELQSFSQPKDLNITADPDSIHVAVKYVDVTFTITAKNNVKGIYPLSLNFCGNVPLIVGLNESEINPAKLKEYFTAIYHCPAITDFTPSMDVLGSSGIISRNIEINPDNSMNVTSGKNWFTPVSLIDNYEKNYSQANYFSMKLGAESNLYYFLNYLIVSEKVTTHTNIQTGVPVYSKPSWITNTFGWWIKDQISDEEILNAIQYLMDKNIITIRF